MTEREAFLFACLEQLGKPVLWGKKGPNVFDCSGLATFAYRSATGVDWLVTHNSQALFEQLAEPAVPRPGDLCFWRPKGKFDGRVEHVGILLPGGHVLTADGATSRVTSLEVANSQGARVRVRPSVEYRLQFAGFRRLPFKGE